MPGKRSEVRQRQQVTGVRLLPAERATLEAAARAQQVTLSEFIRRSALAAAGKKES